MERFRASIRGSTIALLVIALPLGCAQASAAAPSPTPTPTPADALDPEIERVRAAVAALRELPFRHAVASSPQSRDQFRQVVRDEIAKELGPKKNAALSRALAFTGFLPGPLDFAAALEEAETSQVAAYYDPRTDRFHTVAVSSGADERDVVVAHELTHALQHQYFDLVAYDGGPDNADKLSDDERAARRYVVEGEATFVMLAYQAASGSGTTRHLGPLQVAGVRMTLTMLSAIDYADLLAVIRTGDQASKLDAESRAALDALAKLPPLVAISMVDAYFRGAFLISEAWARGGWARVAQLYREPPRSTEQVLHPIEKLLDGRDPPIAIHLPSLAPAAAVVPGLAAEPLLQETAGELDWRCYFKTWGDREPEQSAAGWGGDLVTVWEGTGNPIAATATRWDTPADAAKFAQAYRRSLIRRFGKPAQAKASTQTKAKTQAKAKLKPAQGPTRAPLEETDPTPTHRPDGTAIVVEQRGLDVDIVDGARPGEIEPLLAMLRAADRAATAANPAPARAR